MTWEIRKFRFTGPGHHEVVMPAGSVPISFQSQREVLTLWAKCPIENPPTRRRFRIVGTGWHFGGEFEEYVGTAQVSGGEFVWHLFEVRA